MDKIYSQNLNYFPKTQKTWQISNSLRPNNEMKMQIITSQAPKTYKPNHLSKALYKELYKMPALRKTKKQKIKPPINKLFYLFKRLEVKIHKRASFNIHDPDLWNHHTLARTSSCSVLTPNLGILELVRLELCINFLTPLIWDIGLFFFSFSFWVGEGISTSCCLSWEIQKMFYIYY